jgi:hypothetical protein
VLDPQDVPTVVPESLPAVETPVEIITFCDGSHIAIQNQTILYGEGVTGGSMAFSGILPSSPTSALGQVKVIVLNVTYADQNALPSTEARLYATLRDVADHYSKASYGRLSLSGVVVPPIKLERLSGSWDVPAAAAGEGEYYFVRLSFSNAHSWMTSKRLVRRVDVLVGARGKGGAGVSIAEDLDDELATERTMHRARIAEWVSAAR